MLVGGFKHFLFSTIYGIPFVLPIDELTFFRGVIMSTTIQSIHQAAALPRSRRPSIAPKPKPTMAAAPWSKVEVGEISS